jgi:antitoxin (DNA-binding transcriptional repressor) of toxin-antitoxin stability system
MARSFHNFLGRVEHGETVIIRRHGRTVARLTPEHGFISGKAAADLFRSHPGDHDAADAISREILKLDLETDHALHH